MTPTAHTSNRIPTNHEGPRSCYGLRFTCFLQSCDRRPTVVLQVLQWGHVGPLNVLNGVVGQYEPLCIKNESGILGKAKSPAGGTSREVVPL